MPVLNGQQEGLGSRPDVAALQEAEGFTAEEIAWMRRMGWEPEPASSSDAGERLLSLLTAHCAASAGPAILRACFSNASSYPAFMR